jgi:molybdate transport system substrate-binding protein
MARRIGPALVGVLLGFGLILASAAPLTAAELIVVASTAMREAMEAIVPRFEQASGQKVEISFLSGAVLPVKIREGLAADLVITTPETIAALVKDGKLVAGSRVDIVRSRVGVAVRAGAAKPDISTADAFKATLLAARSVGISKGPSGVYLMGVLERLGIADEIKAKTVTPELGQRVGTAVANGTAEIGIQQIAELLPIPGIDYVGPLPDALQTTIVYATARPAGAAQPDAAAALVAFLTSAPVIEILRGLGLEPA